MQDAAEMQQQPPTNEVGVAPFGYVPSEEFSRLVAENYHLTRYVARLEARIRDLTNGKDD